MPKTKVLIEVAGTGTCLAPDYRDTVVEIYETEGLAHDNAIGASIETSRCMIFSVNEKPTQLNFMHELFSDAANMQLYEVGLPLTQDAINKRYSDARALWKNRNPFSYFTIEDKDTGKYLGQSEMLEMKRANTSEYGIAISKEHWRKGFGTEVTVAHSYFWAPYLAEHGYKVNGTQQLETIYGTAHPDNGTAKIFRKAGYNFKDTIFHPIYGGEREVFLLSVEKAKGIRDNSMRMV